MKRLVSHGAGLATPLIVSLLLSLTGCSEKKKVNLAASITASPAETAIQWVRLEGGRFQMGSKRGDDDERPMHTVLVSTFELAKSEVTVAQYFACVKAGACTDPHWEDDSCVILNGTGWDWTRLPDDFRGNDQPVVCVDWEQAQAFSKWVGGRLPTEAEWEFAARSGGQNWKYPWGDEEATCERTIRAIDDKWQSEKHRGCGKNSTWPVCSKKAGHSKQGVCDLAGNAYEWVQDWSDPEYYASSPVKDPTGPSEGDERVRRGGSWYRGAGRLKATSRSGDEPDVSKSILGFRPARPVTPSPLPTSLDSD